MSHRLFIFIALISMTEAAINKAQIKKEPVPKNTHI